MSEEEKKAIEYIEQFIGIEKQYKYKPIKIKTLTNTRPAITTILNLIENQQKEIADLKQINEEHRKLNGELREEINKLKKEKEDILAFWEE